MRKTKKQAARTTGKRKATATRRRRAKTKPCPHTHANFEQIRNHESPDVQVDVAAGRMIAAARGLRETESFYFHDDGAMAIATGDQDDAYAWDISRPLAEQLAETAADDAAADALESWSCPVESNECAIRQQCTNKCGLKHVAPEKRMDAWLDLFDVPPALPADGDPSKLPVLNLDALEYELTRAAEPDCRDEDGPEVERIMAEMEHSNG